LLLEILKTEWREVSQGEWVDAEEAIAGILSSAFPSSIEGVSPAEARELVEKAPPILQIKQIFASPKVWREMTAFEALHLRFDGVALLAETLIQRYGKQGELIVYDLLREERLKAGGGKTGSVAEFLSDFIAAPKEANLFTAGIESQVVKVSEHEVVLHIKECAWARYFRERHPQVGYLMACSTDEVAYRAFNENLRMQRTSTLMEGGQVCDFRIYTPNNAPGLQ
jgi:predicted hydrocarbon binding protein